MVPEAVQPDFIGGSPMRILTCIVAAAGLGFAVDGRLATAAEGEFNVTYSVTDGTEGAWLQIGPNERQQMNLLELSTQENTTAAACQYTRKEDTTSGAYTNTAWCAWRDKDDDLFFEQWEGSAAGGDAVLIGSGRLSAAPASSAASMAPSLAVRRPDGALAGLLRLAG
jgi:hypothetical protein